MIRKALKVVKKCVENPSLIKKGIIYIRENGLYSIKDKINNKYYIQEEVFVKSSQYDRFDGNIKFSIVMPVYNVEVKWLEEAINSIKNQNYVNWELCIADDCSTEKEVKEYLSNLDDNRIKTTYLSKNLGIADASNEAAKMATGDYIILMDNDDIVSYDALFEFALKIKETDADIIYSDQDIVDMNGEHRDPLFKPDWSIDLFLSQMYMGHLLGFKKALFNDVKGFRKEFTGSQDYDLVLRMINKTKKIEHVDKILYSWRDIPSSTAANPHSKPYAQTAGLNAIQSYLDESYEKNHAKAYETNNLFVYDVRYNLNDNVKISLIMPTKDHVELLKDAVQSILEISTYKNFEIIILNNNSEEQKTLDYFKVITEKYPNIFVYDALFEFNWSKLNNFGISKAKGDVFVFINNDIKVITPDWMERMAEKALRKDVGVVGGLLLYEDGTIQHAGVIVGIGGWADHVFKGHQLQHYGSPFVSPMVTRNVTAVTGALMAISRDRIEEIGRFDEGFIICGSDIELCIRAYYRGYNNIYDPYVKMFHYESKSRDSYIPEVDFEMSYFSYATFRNEGDPYYNNNLDYTKSSPSVSENEQFPRRKSDAMKSLLDLKNTKKMNDSEIEIAEITPYNFRKSESRRKRINLLVPSINQEHVFGGISTAIKFFEKLVSESGFDSRIILTDAVPNRRAIKKFGKKYTLVNLKTDKEYPHQIISYSDRYNKSIPVSEHDIFMFTGWWTAYCTQEAYLDYEKVYGISPNKFIYFVQDYEPGFYSWSSRYLLADSTYKSDYEQIAVFNSKLLYDFFKNNGYKFHAEYYFDPVLNENLYEKLLSIKGSVKKKKQILVYGRPSVERNAFSIVVQSLRKWVNLQDNANEWNIVSAGEAHEPLDLGKGVSLVSLGKLTLDNYALTMAESYAGISLMASPHPSYPPLEMSVFGVKVITNSYSNKDLSSFNKNIYSLDNTSPSSISRKLNELTSKYNEMSEIMIEENSYIKNEAVFNFISEIIKKLEG